VFSLSAPVPPAVEALAADLAGPLSAFERRRREPALLVKRLEDKDRHRTEKRIRETLRGASPVEARIESIGVFENPPRGPGPVVYLAVESPGLVDLHQRVCERFDPVPELEGEGFTPHVTLARGLDGPVPERSPVDDLDGRAVGPVTWTVDELQLYDVVRADPEGRIVLRES
jgi:2'-5' RNA ligase